MYFTDLALNIMTKIRLYFDVNFKTSEVVVPNRSIQHYLVQVMRKKDSEEIYIFNEKEEWKAKIFLKKKFLIVPQSFYRKNKKKNLDIWICFSLIKSKNFNYLLEKISEIGVKKIIPFVSEFSERYKLNYERCNKIIIEAVEQSNSMLIPEFRVLTELKDLLADWDRERDIIFCNEKGKGKKIIDLPLKKKVAIFIGPVGGWSEKDKILFRDLKFYNVSLGENILKADTAAISSLSLVKEKLL